MRGVVMVVGRAMAAAMAVVAAPMVTVAVAVAVAAMAATSAVTLAAAAVAVSSAAMAVSALWVVGVVKEGAAAMLCVATDRHIRVGTWGGLTGEPLPSAQRPACSSFRYPRRLVSGLFSSKSNTSSI